ncbi:MAG: hypothetical protein ACFCGT_02230 [Sandaracinaceae bacterium]
MTELRRRLARAGAAFAVAAPVAYVAARLFEVARAPVPADPTLILADAHTALYWRAGVALWWGAVIALVVGRSGPRGAGPRVAPWRWVVPVVVALAALAWHFP